jgi:hypothetical protein
MPGRRIIRQVDGSPADSVFIPAEPGDERAYFMRCPCCGEFFDMRDLREVTLHYDFSLTTTPDGRLTMWPILGHAAPGLRTDPAEIAWLEGFHGAKGEAAAGPPDRRS